MTEPAASGHDQPQEAKISRSTGVQVGSHNVMTVHQHLYPAAHEVVWPVRVGPVVSPADGFQHRQVESLWEPVHVGGRTVVLTQVLRGMGGVGKTQLAAGLADRVWRQGEVDLLVWITARDRTSIISGFAEAAAAVGIGADTPEHGAGRMRDWLARIGKRWLVVLDDVSVPADLNGWWPPQSPVGVTVVTTRRRDAALSGQGRHLVDIDVFTPAEAHAYLSGKLAAHPHLGDEIVGVAQDLGFLPLALAQAAAFMLDRGITCSQYRQRLAARRLEQVVPEPGSLPDQHQATVNATWSLSIDAADRLPPAGLARPVLELCSLLDPNGIPREVLATAAVGALLGIDRDANDTAGSRSELVDDAVAVLHRLSLVDLTSTTDGAQQPGALVRVHALVQRAVREGLTPERRDRIALAAADALHQAWPPIDNQPGFIHTLYANTISLTVNHSGPLWTQADGGHQVLFKAGNSMGNLGQVHAAITHFQSLHQTAELRLGVDQPDTLATRANLAYWRGRAGEAGGAAAAFAQLLDDRLRVLGADHPNTLATRANLAYWRGRAGDAAGAAADLAELLHDRLRVFGPDHYDTLATRANLAYWRGQVGDAAGAAADLAELLNDRLRVLGPDHPDTLATHANLAYWRGQAGDATGAAAAFAQLLKDYLRVLGADHPDTLATRHNLAYWRGQAGDAAAAAAAFAQLLKDYLRVLGPDHPDTLTTHHELAHWRGQAGDATGAAAALAGLLNDHLRVLGADHPNTLTTRHNLAYWRGQAGDATGAAAAFAQLLNDYLRVLGADHPDTLNTRHNLAYWSDQAS